MSFFSSVSKFSTLKKIKEQRTSKNDAAINRIYFLDGIRGWGAIMVVLFHFYILGFPISLEASVFLKKIFLFNGGMAVYLFFIASGFSLTIGYFNKQNSIILKKYWPEDM